MFRKKRRIGKLSATQKARIIRGLRRNYGYDSSQMIEVLMRKNQDRLGSEPVSGV